ncbi:MFS transporter [Cupriavidus gilardii]|uniref:MFS transporter n=1 Tax=Cupriavidus gilardii TaxID=82541 RepID=UPI001EE4FF1F|nr:MFS transporter [Cupriavidus gilardii]MCG5258821.1 MFS transporter [Cupriavidus gilardii]MDF9429336.1 MFS transporter [Cupriavidus gilardii]
MMGRRFAILLAAVTLLALTDAINSTLMMVNRAHFAGGLQATLDEAAWLNILYFAAKPAGFVVAAAVARRFGESTVLRWSGVLLVASTAAASLPLDLAMLCACRVVQGASAALMLATAQALLFRAAPPRWTPLSQAVFALATVMAPTTLAPLAQGWVTDHGSWRQVFLAGVPFGLMGLMGLVLPTLRREPARPCGDGAASGAPSALDPIDIALLIVASVATVFVLQEGNRHDWLHSPRIVQAGLLAATTLLLAAWRQRRRDGARWLQARLFRDPHFAFGFCVSFVAGFALFGSAFLLPAFALNVLRLSPTHAGDLLSSSAATASLGLLLGGALAQYTRLAPFKLIPLGIVLFMLAMGMLAYATAYSGLPDMTPPLLIRGFGLGLMFISLTLVTLGGLPTELACQGAALFNFGRQFGGLIGIAFLQSYLHHRHGAARTALVETLPVGADVPLAAASTESPMGQALSHIDPAMAMGATLEPLLERQAGALAFNAGFLSLALLFVVAIPVLLAIKAALGRYAGDTAAH